MTLLVQSSNNETWRDRGCDRLSPVREPEILCMHTLLRSAC